MTSQPLPPKRIFPTSKVEARAAEHVPSVPQTESSAYKLAYQDTEFLLREDLRPVRFQLELLKPELLLNEGGVAVVPGSGFGAPGHIRISFACSMQTLEKAMERMGRVLEVGRPVAQTA